MSASREVKHAGGQTARGLSLSLCFSEAAVQVTQRGIWKDPAAGGDGGKGVTQLYRHLAWGAGLVPEPSAPLSATRHPRGGVLSLCSALLLPLSCSLSCWLGRPGVSVGAFAQPLCVLSVCQGCALCWGPLSGSLCCIRGPRKHLWSMVARAGFWVVLNQDRFSLSPGGPSIDRLCLVALPPSSSPARMGRGWGTTRHGPDPMASVTCHAHLKGGGKEGEKLCGQLTVSVKHSSFLFCRWSGIPISLRAFHSSS